MDKKKAAKAHYKENPPEMGVLQAHNKRTGQSIIFGTTSLTGKVNSVTFQLEMGSFVDKEFQKSYDAGSPDDIEFKVLEVLKRDKSPAYNYRDDLKLLAKKWQEQL